MPHMVPWSSNPDATENRCDRAAAFSCRTGRRGPRICNRLNMYWATPCCNHCRCRRLGWIYRLAWKEDECHIPFERLHGRACNNSNIGDCCELPGRMAPDPFCWDTLLQYIGHTAAFSGSQTAGHCNHPFCRRYIPFRFYSCRNPATALRSCLHSLVNSRRSLSWW